MVVRFASFELDFRRFVLHRDGQRVPMRPKVFDLLAHLVRHRDRVVTREELFDVLWGETRVAKGSLSGLVNELRQALGERGHASSSIRTLHARGYQFVAPVEVEGASEGPVRAPEPWSGAEDVLVHLRHAFGRALRDGVRLLEVEGGTPAARRSLVARAIGLARALGFAALQLESSREGGAEEPERAFHLLARARERPLLVVIRADVAPDDETDALVRAFFEVGDGEVPLVVLVVAGTLSPQCADRAAAVRLRLAESERALVDRWMRARGMDPLPDVLAEALVAHLSGHASAIDVTLGGLASEAACRFEPGLGGGRVDGGDPTHASPMRRVPPSSDVATARETSRELSAREIASPGTTADASRSRPRGRLGASGE